MSLVSVVIPVYNEAGNLPTLFTRLYPVLDGLGRPYEVVFTNDGSQDGSFALLAAQHAQRPDVTRVIDFNSNYGQHMAIMAAFERSKGDVIVTLDADLQNPPEEIPKLLERIDAGYDYVGGYRVARQDSFFRRHASRLVNWVREHTTNIEMRDQGCMLRAYRRPVVDAIVQSGAMNTFIPALAYSVASRPTEIPVKHEERHAGVSNYSFYRLIRLNFDLITAFSLAPLQYFTMFAIGSSAASLALVLVLAYRRIFLGAEAEGIFTLFGVLFFLLSVAMIGIGLIGEYVGRT
ncbi:MAG TPA: glycosyltransferase, partial [Opitutaceae bacterium]|nr:glycosyltransferase [Opitutaceae bacterium]